MVKTQAEAKDQRQARLETPGIRRVVQLLVAGVVLGLLLFGAAGRLDWLAGWLFVGVFLAYVIGMSLWCLRHDPELLNERGRAFSENVERREKALVLFVTFLQLATVILAALDAGRFGWSAMPPAVQVTGWLLAIPTVALPAWVMMTNTYAAVNARVQEERGHQVVTTGPYRYVRHPMYVGVVLLGVSAPLALGSWWALIPGLALSVVFVFRAAAEDRLLRATLPGYAEYAGRVRSRLLPGIW